ncbi:unnamed protein product [Callosobruchus maculatus]|uniref:Uncharacterized protein n=1 Tax=Callosobruchus maculatus TaxID=64391 RepID=A0A653CY40_CALMS|nr:unnamed protein product [Callosobruchus maculatus]
MLVILNLLLFRALKQAQQRRDILLSKKNQKNECVPGGRSTAGGGDDAARHLQHLHRIPGLLCGQHVDPVHELLHHPQLPDQLRHLLRHVPPVPGDLQGPVREGCAQHQERILEVLHRERTAHLHQRDGFVTKAVEALGRSLTH